MPDGQPNIVVLIADNVYSGMVGCYGNSEHETPALDHLARTGVRFDRAYCVGPACSSNRASLLTACMPSQHGVYAHLPEDSEREQFPRSFDVTSEFPTLPTLLSKADYATALFGKWHLGFARGAVRGFSHACVWPRSGPWDFYRDTYYENGAPVRHGGQHLDLQFADEFGAYIDRRDDGRPFFAYIAFPGPFTAAPVLGPDPENPYYEEFSRRTFRPFPRIADAVGRALPAGPFGDSEVQQWVWSANSPVDLAAWLKSYAWAGIVSHNDHETRANIAAQLRVNDEAVSRVVHSLERADLLGDTIVVYLSDHGLPYGHRGYNGTFDALCPYPVYREQAQIPLIISHPGQIEARQVCDQVVSTVDVPCGLLKAAGQSLDCLDEPAGRDLLRLFSPPADWVDEAFTDFEESRAIHTREFMYSRASPEFVEAAQSSGAQSGPCEYLFDLVNDPDQKVDLSTEPAHEATREALSSRLDSYFAAHSAERYDLWRGGHPRFAVLREEIWRAAWGPGWAVDNRPLA